MEIKRITENTLIPISIVVSLLGLSSWITVVWSQGVTNADDIHVMNEDRKILARRQNDKLDDILQRLSHIEGMLSASKGR